MVDLVEATATAPRPLDAADAERRRPRRADARPDLPDGDGLRPERRTGCSHNIAEFTEAADIEAGANVLLQVVLDLLSGDDR